MEMEAQQIEAFEVGDLEVDVLPGGASEPVLHAGAVVAGIILVWSTAAR